MDYESEMSDSCSSNESRPDVSRKSAKGFSPVTGYNHNLDNARINPSVPEQIGIEVQRVNNAANPTCQPIFQNYLRSHLQVSST